MDSLDRESISDHLYSLLLRETLVTTRVHLDGSISFYSFREMDPSTYCFNNMGPYKGEF